MFVYWVFKNFRTTDIQGKVGGEKNQRCMKQQILSSVEFEIRGHSGREGLRISLHTWLLTMLLVNTFPLFVKEIHVNFDV